MHDEPEDTELEDELREVIARVDQVPARLLQAAVGSFAWRTVDADLAELVFDSLLDQDETALVRGRGQGRVLSFETDGLTIDVEIDDGTLTGQLLPSQRAAVELRQGDDVARLEADELGRFIAGPLRAGPFSLRCSVGAGRLVVTDWISV